MSYSRDLKERAIKYKETHKLEETLEAFGIAKSTFYEWKKEFAKEAEMVAKGEKIEKPKRTYEKKINKETLKKAVEEKPDSELSELAELFNCSFQAVSKALKSMGITRKKRRLPTQKNPKKSVQNTSKN
jgi:transposase